MYIIVDICLNLNDHIIIMPSYSIIYLSEYMPHDLWKAAKSAGPAGRHFMIFMI